MAEGVLETKNIAYTLSNSAGGMVNNSMVAIDLYELADFVIYAPHELPDVTLNLGYEITGYIVQHDPNQTLQTNLNQINVPYTAGNPITIQVVVEYVGIKHLSKAGLRYFWSKIKTLLNNKQDKLTAGQGINIDTNNQITSYAHTTEQLFSIPITQWLDGEASDDFVAYRTDTPTYYNYAQAKVVYCTFFESQTKNAKIMGECGIILKEVTTDSLKFVCLNKKPTESVTIKVVAIW